MLRSNAICGRHFENVGDAQQRLVAAAVANHLQAVDIKQRFLEFSSIRFGDP